MFRIISFVLFLCTFTWLGHVLVKRVPVRNKIRRAIADAGENSLSTVRDFKSVSFSAAVRYLLLPLLVVCIVLMGVTGFIPALILGKPLSGYMLMLHVAVAPLFSLCMVVMSLAWPYKHRFDAGDWDYVRGILRRKRARKKDRNPSGTFYQRLFFWLILILSVPLISSMLFSMYPVFGSIGQDLLREVHRYCALFYVLAAIAYAWRAVME